MQHTLTRQRCGTRLRKHFQATRGVTLKKTNRTIAKRCQLAKNKKLVWHVQTQTADSAIGLISATGGKHPSIITFGQKLQPFTFSLHVLVLAWGLWSLHLKVNQLGPTNICPPPPHQVQKHTERDYREKTLTGLVPPHLPLRKQNTHSLIRKRDMITPNTSLLENLHFAVSQISNFLGIYFLISEFKTFIFKIKTYILN